MEFRFYKGAEYAKLTKEQKRELDEHRSKKRTDAGDNTKSRKTRFKDDDAKKWIAAAVQQQLEKHNDDIKEQNEADADMRRYIMSVVSGTQAAPTQSATSSATKAADPVVTLQSILRRAKKR